MVNRSSLLPPGIRSLVDRSDSCSICRDRSLHGLLYASRSSRFRRSGFSRGDRAGTATNRLSDPQDRRAFQTVQTTQFIHTGSICSGNLAQRITRFHTMINQPIGRRCIDIASAPVDFYVMENISILMRDTIFEVNDSAGLMACPKKRVSKWR